MSQAEDDLKEFTSVSSADTSTFSGANAADWVQVIGAGSTVVVTKAGESRTITTDAAEPAAVFKGKFSAFTSTSATRVRMGRGGMPAIVVPASAVPATTAAVGGTTMSVAPASAATPIAVGTNDPRVTQVEIPISLATADGVYAEAPVWIPGVAATILSASLSSSSAITQNDTNYLTFTLSIRDGAGGGASSVASKTTQVTGGASFLAFQAVSLGTISNPTTTATSQVTFKSVKTAGGQAVTNGALLRITYSVP